MQISTDNSTTNSCYSFLSQSALVALESWAHWADRQRCLHAADARLACFGPGYLHWGVQSNWNYIAVMATLSAQPKVAEAGRWRRRALAALRYALATHATGTLAGNDGRQWGHSWISALGVERAMHGLRHLFESMGPELRRGLRRLLLSEAEWIYHDGRRQAERHGVIAGRWSADGKNVPESNIWCGAFLWRVACMYPQEPAAAAWRERAHQYLINGVSVPADENDHTRMAGKSVGERYAGANFFPRYALDHHGYLNVGYMAICLSNAAILHFDAKQHNFPRPETLDHHQDDLWRVLRRMVFRDGRLARIGGDSRVRYAYCQEYLLPALLYAADRFRDPHALAMAEQQLGWSTKEAANRRDGSFYGGRVSWLARTNPHYHTRLESDRAVVLAMLVNYLPLVDPPAPAVDDFEDSVEGGWCEVEHGAALHRSATRFASFSWRAYGLGQALCVPPRHSDLAEWSRNLCPVVRFLGDHHPDGLPHRRLQGYTIASFPGGFVTCGSIMEGADVKVDEGAFCTDQASADLAFAALPDGHTCVVLQRVTAAADRRGVLAELKGLHLNVPNDWFNGHRRKFIAAKGALELAAPASRDETIALDGDWVNVDDTLGVALCRGLGDRLVIDRSAQARGGVYRSLAVEEICCGHRERPAPVDPAETLLDVGFAVLAGATAEQTAQCSVERLTLAKPDLRGLRVAGFDGKTYAVVANFGSHDTPAELFGRSVPLPAGTAAVVSDTGWMSGDNDGARHSWRAASRKRCPSP